MNLKGSLPLLILSILAEGPNHGYQINRTINDSSAGVLSFKEGTLYPTLHKLEQNGHIQGYDDQSTGRRRRYYRLTDAGRETLHGQREEWSSFVEAVNTVLAYRNGNGAD